ncbi:DUF756 domain-containing protein [Curtobacterium flaccumfaciens]|nr:DUF756 domain-containing protein [Curtobacterium flaccumfaciens]
MPFAAHPKTVPVGASADWVWDTTTTGGAYDVSVYGPDRFLRRFAGTVTVGGRATGGVPHVSVVRDTRGRRTLQLLLENTGTGELRFELVANDFVEHRETARPWVRAQDDALAARRVGLLRRGRHRGRCARVPVPVRRARGALTRADPWGSAGAVRPRRRRDGKPGASWHRASRLVS